MGVTRGELWKWSWRTDGKRFTCSTWMERLFLERWPLNEEPWTRIMFFIVTFIYYLFKLIILWQIWRSTSYSKSRASKWSILGSKLSLSGRLVRRMISFNCRRKSLHLQTFERYVRPSFRNVTSRNLQGFRCSIRTFVLNVINNFSAILCQNYLWE